MGTGVHSCAWGVSWLAASTAILMAGCSFDTSGLPGTGAGGADGGAGGPTADAGVGTPGPDAGRPGPSPDARTATPPDARQPPAAVWQNILRNSNFEAADMFWSEQNSFGYQIIADEETYGPAYNGDWAAWFGGINDEHATLSQEVFVPSGTTQVRVRGWIYISTQYSGDADKIEFRLEPAGVSANAGVLSLESFLGTDAGSSGVSGWMSFEGVVSNVDDNAGYRFTIKSDTNGYDSAMFVVDDVVLEAFAPAPQ